ncbi:MAG TPA: DUF5667 domain-containing protein [Alphaproteobacteria bacterium]|jgi:hypothetical protein|nr:DUF5667 domain-containing protein [Alphaproteobacteria bacterium]
MKKYFLGSAVFALAFGVFLVSAMSASSPRRVFASTLPTPQPVISIANSIDYILPFPGKVLPDSPFWSLKALRDKLQYSFTFNKIKKAELALLFADKRLASSKTLFENKKPDIALATLTKAEKYLEIAAGEKTNPEFLVKLANASLKHRQIIEEEILPLAPEDAKPEIIRLEMYPKNTYKICSEVLISLGKPAPKDPFLGH